MIYRLLDLCDVKPVKVVGTTYHAHELKTQLKRIGKVKVVVSWKEADLSDSPKYHAASHRGWQAKAVLGRYVRWWEVEESCRDAKQHLGLGRCQMQSMEGIRRHCYLVLLMFTLLKLRGCEAGPMKGSDEDGAITLGDCQRALRNEVLPGVRHSAGLRGGRRAVGGEAGNARGADEGAGELG